MLRKIIVTGIVLVALTGTAWACRTVTIVQGGTMTVCTVCGNVITCM